MPSAFITGISGQFYRQFALTIAGATIISLIVSLTLSPALCALLLKPHGEAHEDRLVYVADPRLLPHLQLGLRQALARLRLVRRAASCAFAVLMLVVYVGVIAFGLNEFRKTPDRLHSAARRRLPDHRHAAAARRLARRTDAVNRRVVELALDTPGVAHAVNLVGFSGATRTNAPNAGAVFVVLKPFEERAKDPTHVGAGDPGRAACQVLVDPGRARPRRRAAARARHRQRRRLPHDGGGSRRRRLGRAAEAPSTP